MLPTYFIYLQCEAKKNPSLKLALLQIFGLIQLLSLLSADDRHLKFGFLWPHSVLPIIYASFMIGL